MEITTIGLDLAKRVFQVHGVDAAGKVVIRKALRRAQVLPFFAKLLGLEPMTPWLKVRCSGLITNDLGDNWAIPVGLGINTIRAE
jgi:hypothetical protein